MWKCFSFTKVGPSSPSFFLFCFSLPLFPLIPVPSSALPPPPFCLPPPLTPFSVSHFCAIWVLCHIISITLHPFHVIVMPTFFQALDITHPTKDKWNSSPSHFSSFFTVELFLIKGITLKIHMLCFVSIMRLDLKVIIVTQDNTSTAHWKLKNLEDVPLVELCTLYLHTC